mgnify:CR=1 FL=1
MSQRKYVKTYEIFSFLKKKQNKRMNSKELLAFVIDNYKDLVNDAHFDVDNNNGYIMVSYYKDYKDIAKNDYHVSIRENNGKYEIIDFKDENGKSMYDSDRIRTNSVEITKDEYEEYVRKLTPIDEFIYQNALEKDRNKGMNVGFDGLNNMDEDPVETANLQINEELKSLLNKNYKFDAEYYIWTTPNNNTHHFDEIEVKVTEFKVGLYYGDNSKNKIYGQIIFEFEGEEHKLWVDVDYKAEWVDLSKIPLITKDGDIALRVYDNDDSSSKVKMRKLRNKKYPNTTIRLLTPSKYDTIEMIKTFMELVSGINDGLKGRGQ